MFAPLKLENSAEFHQKMLANVRERSLFSNSNNFPPIAMEICRYFTKFIMFQKNGVCISSRKDVSRWVIVTSSMILRENDLLGFTSTSTGFRIYSSGLGAGERARREHGRGNRHLPANRDYLPFNTVATFSFIGHV